MRAPCNPGMLSWISHKTKIDIIIIWLLHYLVEASFELSRYLLLGNQLKPWELHPLVSYTSCMNLNLFMQNMQNVLLSRPQMLPPLLIWFRPALHWQSKASAHQWTKLGSFWRRLQRYAIKSNRYDVYALINWFHQPLEKTKIGDDHIHHDKVATWWMFGHVYQVIILW